MSIHISWSALAAQTIVGLSLGMIYVLLALGLSLIFGLLGIVNFAHGSFFLLGAYLGFYVLGLTHNFWAALLIGPILVGGIGLAVERVLIRPLNDRGPDAALLVTFGFSLVIVDVVRMIWGKNGVPFDLPRGLNRAVDLGWTLIPTYRLFVVSATVVVLIALWAFLLRTDLGLIIRAGTRDPLMTRALGIRLGRIRFLVFGLGAGLAALAGVMTAPMLNVAPAMGVSMLIESFVVVVVGGMGSIPGAIVAGLLLGLAVSYTVLFAPTMGGIVIFIAMAIVLLVRPRGIFGEAGFLG
ncbi:MAG: branched-chain amino acid ABC transporter permease [Bauldia sp.]